MVAAIETKNLTRRFGNVTALDGVSVSIAKGEFFSLLGPSGCGKTTLLRIIAGLDIPDDGELNLNGRDALPLPAHRRPVNTVFQSYALFPHLTVRENVGFGLRMKKVPPVEIVSRVQQVLELVDIGSLGERRPSQLSGGQKQRVALARAVVNEPEVLLLDEPLGALDLKLRRQLQGELWRLQRRLGITFVYVTHDQEEALALSDRIAVMNRGRVVQMGTPAEIYDRPRTQFAAEFLGSCNILKATVVREHRIQTPFGEMEFHGAGECDRALTFTVRPENICLRSATEGGEGGKVVSVVYSGSQTHYEVESNGQLLKAIVFNTEGGARFSVGARVVVEIPAASLRCLDDE